MGSHHVAVMLRSSDGHGVATAVPLAVAPAPSPGPLDKRQGLNGKLNTTTLYSDAQIAAMQWTCCILAGIGLLLGIVICYWMARMKKVFRHRLIFMLMAADILRSTWLFVFPAVSLAMGGISSRSAFCQVSGFFSNASYDMADWIVLFIAINTAMQVFQPSPSRNGHGGLYPYRYAVYVFVVVVPFTMSALAFVNNSTVGAYLSQGPTCSLPIRPFWYRLALAWIPRYIIIIVVLALYVAIYVHAERQFFDPRPFHRRVSAAIFVYPSSRSTRWLRFFKIRSFKSRRKTAAEANAAMDRERGEAEAKPTTIAFGDVGHNFRAQQTRQSSNATEVNDYSRDVSARSSTIPPLSPEVDGGESRMDSAFTDSTLVTGESSAVMRSPTAARAPSPLPSLGQVDAGDLAWREMRKKHRNIRRQLRLQFVYPIIYFVSWLAPFASHLTLYDEALARRPVFALSIIGFISLALMGIVDFVVFSLRERPWRHIPGSDGTIAGSFVFWKTVERRRRPTASTTAGDSATSSGHRHTTETESSFESSGDESRRASARPLGMPRGRGAGTTTGSAKQTHAFGSTLQTIPSVGDMSGAGAGERSHNNENGARMPREGETAGGEAMRGMRSWDFGVGKGQS